MLSTSRHEAAKESSDEPIDVPVAVVQFKSTTFAVRVAGVVYLLGMSTDKWGE